MFSISAQAIVDECAKLIRKQERYMRRMREDDVRRERREVLPHSANLLRPSYWDIDPGFNPYKVRANAESIARAVSLALRHGDYMPRAPIAHQVAKSDGSPRTVSVFQIADSVVSRQTYDSLFAKNYALMSARSYAYRRDLSTHDAIQYIASEFKTSERIFIAEYDFSKYFNSISHEYLWRVLHENRFLVTPLERHILKSFLCAPLMEADVYSPNPSPNVDAVGLPQGTSVSLFLANAAAWELDRGLERIGVGFVRYADDTLIWSRDYGQIVEAVNVLRRTSADIGAELNIKKSQGVRLFVPEGEPTEIKATSEVNFVGYRFSSGGAIGLRSQVLDRMRARINYLIWTNLLQAPQQGTFSAHRIADPIDRDYLVLIMQLRRYLYGNLTESKVREFQRGAVKRMRYPGVMSYFPLVDDAVQLKQFDGWLASMLHLGLRKRGAILAAQGVSALPFPHGLAKEELIRAEGRASAGVKIDLTAPSVTRFSSVLRQAASLYGANVVGQGNGSDQYRYMLAGM